MEPFKDEDFVATLESLRPAPRPAFAAKLDERAVAGFPRRSRLGASPLGRLANRFSAIQPRCALLPAGATALAALAAITVIVALGDGAPSGIRVGSPDMTDSPASSPPAMVGKGGAGVQYEAAPPVAGQSKGLSGSAAGATSAAPPAQAIEPFPRSSGPYASQAPRREIQRSAELILGTDPGGVRKAASGVFETAHAYRGIVLSSSIRDGAEGEAGARFELLIPSSKLSDALAAFSGIAAVRSRHEETADITAPTVRTGEQLRDSRATIEGLLTQLSRADTETERAAVEARLRSERRHTAYLRSQLASLERRANLSHVSLRIETGNPSGPPTESGSWGVGDALDDAGRILAIAAGVTIVGLAIVGPIALIALLAWLGNRARIRRDRQRALA